MKSKLKLLVIVLLSSMSFAFSQNVDGYTFHDRDQGVSLYYKHTKYGVTFRAVNNREETVYVKIVNVVSKWSDGRTRQKDVNIGLVRSGGAANGGGLNLDNYSTIGAWSFDSWKWSNRPYGY